MLLEKDHIEIPQLSLEYQARKSLEQLQEWVILLSNGPYHPHELRQPLHALAERYNSQHIHPLIDAAFYIDDAQRGLPTEAIEAFSACERLFIGQELMHSNPYVSSLLGGTMLSLIDQDKERVQTMRRLVIKENGRLKIADLWSDIVRYHTLEELENLQKCNNINACEVTRAKNLISFINKKEYKYPSENFVIRGWVPIHEAKIGKIPEYSSF